MKNGRKLQKNRYASVFRYKNILFFLDYHYTLQKKFAQRRKKLNFNF